MGQCLWMREDARWEEQRAKASVSSPWRSPAGSHLAICAILAMPMPPLSFLPQDLPDPAALTHHYLSSNPLVGIWVAPQ